MAIITKMNNSTIQLLIRYQMTNNNQKETDRVGQNTSLVHNTDKKQKVYEYYTSKIQYIIEN